MPVICENYESIAFAEVKIMGKKTTLFACMYGCGEECIIHYSRDSIMYVLMKNKYIFTSVTVV